MQQRYRRHGRKSKKKKKNMLRDGKDSGQGAVEEMRGSEEELVV